MHPFINIATRAARRAGDIIRRAHIRADALDVTTKELNDFVTNIDKEAEKAIIATIQQSYPDHAILSEESGHVQKSTNTESPFTWVIDPLDGTRNFIHRFPHFAVSIAIQNKGVIEHGLVYDPIRDELFTATRGAGARLNEHRIRVSHQRKLEGSLLGTGFPFRLKHRLPTYLRMFETLLSEAGDIRRAGAAALDLVYVAAGRLDGYWEMGLNAWDIAAGALIVKEAGGFVSDFSGDPRFLESGDIVAANPNVYKSLLPAVRQFHQ